MRRRERACVPWCPWRSERASDSPSLGTALAPALQDCVLLPTGRVQEFLISRISLSGWVVTRQYISMYQISWWVGGWSVLIS